MRPRAEYYIHIPNATDDVISNDIYGLNVFYILLRFIFYKSWLS